jgi:predicted nuclease of restriction endonuclease-like (RecB) superfamily
VQAVLAQITWYYDLTLLEKLGAEAERIWYAKNAIQHGWSRNVLVHQIETALHKRLGTAVTNFERTLPPAQSDLAQQITKDPYAFDFLMLGDDARERELEQGLLAHLRTSFWN